MTRPAAFLLSCTCRHALMAAALFGFASLAHGVNTSTWDNAGGTDMNTAGNWTPVGVPNGNELSFNGISVANPNLSASLSEVEILFGATANGYDLTGSDPSVSFTLAGATIVAGLNTSGTNTVATSLDFTSTAGVTISQAIGGETLVMSGSISSTGTGAVIVGGATGGGTIRFTGTNNSYSGGILIGGGTGAIVVTSLGNAGANGSVGTGTITLGNGTNNASAMDFNYVGSGETSNKTFYLDSTNAATATLDTIDTSGETGALTLSGTITGNAGSGAKPILQLVSNDTLGDTVSGVISNGTNGATLVVKTGTGNWTLSGTNTYTGTTTVGGGELILQYNTSPSAQVLAAGDVLTLQSEYWVVGTRTLLSSVAGSETLVLDGANSTANAQTLGNITLGAGASHLDVNAGAAGGTFALTLGALPTSYANSGATLDIEIGAGATVTTTTTSAATGTGSGLFGDPTTVNGNDWATNEGNASNPIVGLSTVAGGYSTVTTISATSAKAIDVQAGTTTVTASATIPALRFNQAGSTFSIASGKTVSLTSGILMTGSASFTDITGGSITESSGNRSLPIIQNNTSANLEIDSTIVNTAVNTAAGLTKSGAGLVQLTAANTYTGTTVINEGTLQITNGSGLGFGGLAPVSNGTVVTGVTQVGVGATLDLAPATSMTVDEPITLYGASLINSGTGTATLDNGVAGINITQSGTGSATSGTVSIGGSGGSTATVAMTGTGVLTSVTVTNAGTGYTSPPTVTITTSGGTETTAPTGTAVLSSLTLNGTTNNIGGSGNLIINAAIADGSNPGGFTKTGTGTVTLSGANTYSGGTTIGAGALNVTNTSGSATGSGAVALDAAALMGTGTVSGLVTANNGGGSVITAATTGSIGNLSLGGIQSSGGLTLNLAVNGAGTTFSTLTLGSAGMAITGGTLTFNLYDLGQGTLTADTPYTIITGTGALSAGSITANLLNSGYALDTAYGDDGILLNGDVATFEIESVPEPSTWMLLLGGVAFLVIFHKRRQLKLRLS